MRANPSAPPRQPGRPSHHELVAAASRLIDQATSAEPGSSLWFIATEGDEVDIGYRSIDRHPFDELAGFTAPLAWDALGVRAVGRGLHVDRAGAPPARVAATIVVARNGATSSRLRWLDGGVVDDRPGPVEGLIADACRRALGLATPPPDAPAVAAWARVWLDRLVEAGGDAGRRLRSVAAAVALHPAARAASPDGTWVLADPDGLVAAALDHAAVWHWGRLRAEPLALGPIGAGLPAAVAEWMDEGLFCRWVIAELPDPDQLLGAVHDLLPASVARHVAGVARTLLTVPCGA